MDKKGKDDGEKKSPPKKSNEDTQGPPNPDPKENVTGQYYDSSSEEEMPKPEPKKKIEEDSDSDYDPFELLAPIPGPHIDIPIVFDSDDSGYVPKYKGVPDWCDSDPSSDEDELEVAMHHLLTGLGHRFAGSPTMEEIEELMRGPQANYLTITQRQAIEENLAKQKKWKYDQEHEDLSQYRVILKGDLDWKGEGGALWNPKYAFFDSDEEAPEENAQFGDSVAESPRIRSDGYMSYRELKVIPEEEEPISDRVDENKESQIAEVAVVEQETNSAVHESEEAPSAAAKVEVIEEEMTQTVNERNDEANQMEVVEEEMTFTDSDSEGQTTCSGRRAEIRRYSAHLEQNEELSFTDSESEDEVPPPPKATRIGFNAVRQVTVNVEEMTFTDSESEDEQIPAPRTNDIKTSGQPLVVEEEMTFTDSESEDEEMPATRTNDINTLVHLQPLVFEEEMTFTDSESDDEEMPITNGFKSWSQPIMFEEEMTFKDSESEDEDCSISATKIKVNNSDQFVAAEEEMTFTDSESEDEEMPATNTNGIKTSGQPLINEEMTFTDSESEDGDY